MAEAGQNRVRLWRSAFAFAAALCFAPSAYAADSVATSTANGFARLLFTLTPTAHATANGDAGVVTISFDRKVALDAVTLSQSLSAYASNVRMDADGKTIRLALVQPAHVHTSASGDRIAIDLAPATFSGTPPDLPPPPPPQKVTAVDPAKLDTVKVRTGAYHNFTRIVFDWPKQVPYSVFPGAGKLTVKFDALAHPDFSALQKQAPPWVKNAAWHVAGKGIIVEFETDTDSGFHDFRDGARIVLDVLAPKTDADAYTPPGTTKVKPTLVAANAQAQVIADTAAKLNNPAATAPAAPAKAIPVSAVTPAQAASTPSPGPAATPVQAAPAPAATTPQAAPVPAATAITLSADGQLTRDGATLTMRGMAHGGSAVFIRSMTAWVVLQDAPPLDITKLKNQLGNFPTSIDATSGDGVSVLRIGLKQPEQIAAFTDGPNLKVVIAPQVPPNAMAIGFTRDQDDPAHASLSTVLGGASHAVTLADPVVGDNIVVVPATAGRAMIGERAFAEFTILKTASGLAVQPLVDDLSVTANATRVIIARLTGLTLTLDTMPTAATSPDALTRHEDAQSYLDFAGWRRSYGGSFLATERRLRTAAARQTAQGANQARLALARFYLVHDFAAEALGTIRLMQGTDPALANDRRLLLMRAVADYEMGRYRDAHNDVAGAAFESDRHAALWRGLIEAALEDWNAARADLDRAGPVLNRYPAEWQARVRIAAAQAGLGLGHPEMADAALGRMPAEIPAALMRTAQVERARLYAAQGRGQEAATLFAAVEHNGDEREAARATYYRVETALADRGLSPAKAINTLENLRYRWRGDTLELKTLRKLSTLYFARRQWQDGLHALRLAAQNSPNDDWARSAQDDMRAAFVKLFLKGGVEGMPPVQALSLFYDNIDLTPIGPDGDEMIRRMADRLASVDLLGPAADLLKYQIDKRLDGVARAQVATKLAAIYLSDHKPELALNTIRSTSISTLPDEVLHQRLLLQARALADLKRWDDALELIAVDKSTDVARLRADICWRSGNWPLAGHMAEESLSTRWSDSIPLTAEDRQQVMRAAVAYSLADDETALDRMREHFSAKMKNGPDSRAFEVVSDRIDDHGIAFRNAAAQVASIDVLQSFMKELRAQTTMAATN